MLSCDVFTFSMCDHFLSLLVTSPLPLIDAAHSRHRRFPPQKRQHSPHDFSNIHPCRKLILSRTRSYHYALQHDVLTFCTSVTTFSQPCWSRRFSPLTTPTNRCHRHRPSAHIQTRISSPIHHAQTSQTTRIKSHRQAPSRHVLPFSCPSPHSATRQSHRTHFSPLKVEKV